MFKMFKPNRRKWQIKQKPSSMPHRTSNFDFQQLLKSKTTHPQSKTIDIYSIGSLTNRFLQTSKSNRQMITNSDNVYSLLKQRMNQKSKIYSSQKSFRKKQSLTHRNFYNGNKSTSSLLNMQNSTSNLVNTQKSSLFKINLNKYRNSKPPARQMSSILSKSNDLISCSQRKSVDKSVNRQAKNLAIQNRNNEIKNKNILKINNEQHLQQSFSSGHGGKSQYCNIHIYLQNKQEQRQISVRYKVKKIYGLIHFLKNYINQIQSKNRFSNQSTYQQQQIASFQTTDYNLQLDYYLTLQQEDGSFLNGQTISIKPFYSKKQPIITLNSFEIIQCIGSGGFSNVYLCRFKQNGKFYAMKVISKSFIVKNQKKKIIMNQRNIMVQLRDQINIAKLYYSFQSKQYIIFVMEYYEGGQLFNLVKKFRKMDQKTARFYITEVLIGLQHIHDHNIAYRDFKPQNIMIDMDGHAYIADFGLAKPNISTIDDRAYSFCGSPQYMPPQMILKDGHSLPVDFYCLGALLYQLVTGLPPFYSTDPQAIYEGTLSEQLSFPEHAILSNQLEDLLLSLLCKDQKFRLGSTFGVQQILSHPWFKSIKKQDFRQKKVTPPINFKKIQDLRFNIDEMQQQNQKQMKQILKNQKLESSAKYLKIMNGFYYDYRFNENLQQKQNVQIELQRQFKKNKTQLLVEKTKNNSESIALTNCTKRSQNSLILGNHVDMKHFINTQPSTKNINNSQQKNNKSQFMKQNKLFIKDKNSNRTLKSVQKRMFKDMNNFFM